MNKDKIEVPSGSGKRKKTPEQKKKEEKLEQDGKDVYNSLNISAYPVMIPPAPNLSKFIDKYDEGAQLSKSNLDSQHRQQDYEAEVAVYRALERLNEEIIVIHGLEYTHGEYTLFVGEHLKKYTTSKKSKKKVGETCKKKSKDTEEECKKKSKDTEEECKKNSKDTEEECDFVVVGHNYSVVIEVKNVCGEGEATLLEAIKETFEISLDQRRRTVKLIEGISKGSAVLQFTAYPNLGQQFKKHFKVSESELSSIIFREDIENIGPWWRDNVTSSVLLPRSLSPFDSPDFQHINWQELWELSGTDFPQLFTLVLLQLYEIVIRHGKTSLTKSGDTVHSINGRVTQILLALWCTEKNRCEKLKCSLGRTIKEIDTKLKSGDFTFQSKNREPNPGIALETPNIIKKFVGVNNLTVQQLAILSSKQKLLYINGPAGSGKTVIMCGKILELALSDDQIKILVITFSGPGNNTDVYRSALEEAKVKTVVLEDLTHQDQSNQVVIIKMQHDWNASLRFDRLTQLVISQEDRNIFIDDAQSIVITPSLRVKSREFVKTLIDLSQTNYVWVTFDMAQMSTNPFTIEYSGSDEWVDKATTVWWQYGIHYTHKELMCPEQRVTLNKNLRNTCDLASITSTIRDLYATHLRSKDIFEDEVDDVLLPGQELGHFRHGPRTTIHVLNEYNPDLVLKIVSKELKELLNLQSSDEKDLQNSDIGIVYNTKVKHNCVIKLINEAVNTECKKPDEIAICSYKDCSSAEWPAVIVLNEIFRVDKKAILNLTEIYTMIARARVKCSVLLFPLPRSDDKNPDGTFMSTLLEKLEPIAQVIRY